ncbi:Zygotic DNA replication licensing factor mcm3 [Camponotus floridanus]|uniref:DNA replication licensing factor MCM3 n=1 Tax=Camponotus floridanus TaxID=104421 RepID=E2AKZ3_CAMFO|nr:DNA replication licensing factor Mcm3 [Camponotus floridanus]XP_011260046.1 DNA replication licensing factor Mcm3 [Camponotus floridanus]EFN65910.1 Zygotic DNA replication licensing factor mcm3 [Camponotus floridanus]
MDTEIDQNLEQITREYVDFLDDMEDQGIYATMVKNMVQENKYRLVVNINDLRRKNPVRSASLLNNSFEEQLAFQNALKQYISSIDIEYAKSNKDFFVAFEGSFGNKHVTPRTLTSHYLGNLVCLEGIVTKCSLVRPKVVRSVHYCDVTKTVLERAYSDLTSLDAFPHSAIYPTTDEDGNPLETEFGLSTYKDHQTLTIQEMPEKAPAGQLPRSVDVICDNDLVDLCKPGDRVQIVGNYRCLPGKQGGYTTGTFKTVLIANNVMQLSKEANLAISHDDVAMCKKMAKNNPCKNIFELLAKSLAPSIHGHEYIKKAILCLLLGGVEKILPNGTRLRGDINVLLIGDPSVAKSQLLRYVLCTAPRAIPTTGRGSSGVGLTAAVTVDQETGERRLEAGAMVLADRGVICIDEFDKMSDIDRTAIHEVMEQGRITIAKAGIHASLNARCSVLAAANPVYGRYDQYKTPMENIGLQDSLLSRFDLLFVMLDVIDSDQDHVISDHVVRMHRYRNPLEQDGEALSLGSKLDMLTTKNPDDVAIEEAQTQVYQKYDPLLHGQTRSKKDQILTIQFMRKYIHIARCMKPKLTEEASAVIAEEYSKLRSEDMVEYDVARTQPVTARTLETLIRLATAHAKARLSKNVEDEDARAAIELVQFAYFKRVLEKEKKKRRRRDSDASENADDIEESRQPKRSKKTKDSDDPYEYDSDDALDVTTRRTTRTQSQRISTPPETMETMETMESVETSTPQTATPTITQERFAIFKSSLHKLFQDRRIQTIPLREVTSYLNTTQSLNFTNDEINAAINTMTEANQIMAAEGNIFLI